MASREGATLTRTETHGMQTEQLISTKENSPVLVKVPYKL